MSDGGKGSRTDEVVRAEAIAWLSKLRSPDGAEQQEAFESWYAADPRHADVYDDVLDTWDRTALAGRTPAGEAQRRLNAGSVAQPRYRIAFAAVAALLLLVLSGIGWQRFGTPRPTLANETQIASQLGEIRTVALPDESRVTLDTATILSVAYTAGERRLTLVRGRARFDVAHDPARPFVVMAGSGMVIAHGTLFDVDLRGERVTVSLLRGSVEVRNAATGEVGEVKGRLLRPGQRLALEQRTPPGSPTDLRAVETRWPSGMLSFEDAPLAEVVAAANRYNAAHIILADPAVGALRFTGTFAATDGQGLARMLAQTFTLDLSHDDHGDIILAPHR